MKLWHALPSIKVLLFLFSPFAYSLLTIAIITNKNSSATAIKKTDQNAFLTASESRKLDNKSVSWPLILTGSIPANI